MGAARSIEVLNKMTTAEADKLGMDQHWRYFSVETARPTCPAGGSQVVQACIRRLGNNTELYPDGDSVGVVSYLEPAKPVGRHNRQGF